MIYYICRRFYMNNGIKRKIQTDEYGFSVFTLIQNGEPIGNGMMDNKCNQLIKYNPNISKIERLTDENNKTTGYKIINRNNPKGYTYYNVNALIEKSKFLTNQRNGRV